MGTWLSMDVSKNRGTPKSSILIGFSIIFIIHFGGFFPPIFGSTSIWNRSYWTPTVQCYHTFDLTSQPRKKTAKTLLWIHCVLRVFPSFVQSYLSRSYQIVAPWLNTKQIGCFQKKYIYINIYIYMGVSKNRGTPKWMVKIMETPIKMDNLGVPLFLETPICIYIYDFFVYPSTEKNLNLCMYCSDMKSDYRNKNTTFSLTHRDALKWKTHLSHSQICSIPSHFVFHWPRRGS